MLEVGKNFKQRVETMKRILTIKERMGEITSAKRLFEHIKKIDIDYKQENFILICLNSKNEIIHEEVMFKGGLNSCIIDPKTIFRVALKHNSNSIIIAHNHPSGDLEPSEDDETTYRMLGKCGEYLHLKLMDSIIFNETEFFSIEY